MSAPIKLSIITVNLNNAAGLSKTLESVASQTFTNYEHIIIDGGSNDGSVDIIKDYERKYNGAPGHLYWVSEPDKGIYNAMNKGIKVASGEYCLFLNSGDYFWQKDSVQLFNSVEKHAQILYFDIYTGPSLKQAHLWQQKDRLSLTELCKGNIAHQSMFFDIQLFHTFGNYREDLRVVADWEFYLRLALIENIRPQKINFALTFYDSNGYSKSTKNREIAQQERNAILKEHFNTAGLKIIEEHFNTLKYYEWTDNSRFCKYLKLIKSKSWKKRK